MSQYQLSNTYENIINDFMNSDKLTDLDIDNFEYQREYTRRFKFIMSNSSYLPIELLEYAQQNLDRKTAINKLEEIIKCYPLAVEIESGIFEFSLNYVKTQLLNHDNIMMIYQDKLFELLDNLDINNKKINNTTLLPALINDIIPGQTISFLKMYQLHPQKWKHIIDKNNLRDDILYTVSTTDAYRCSRCGLSKHSYYITQTRSSDEPATVFFTCINCKKTFTRSM